MNATVTPFPNAPALPPIDGPDVFREIFEKATVGIFQTSPSGRYIRVNPALAAIYGFDSPRDMLAELTDISDQLYLEPERRKQFCLSLESGGVVEDFESQVRRRDGSAIWISETARMVGCHDVCSKVELGCHTRCAERYFYYEGFVIDITKRKALETQLQDATHKLEQRVEQRTRDLTLEVERRRLGEKSLHEALGEAESAAQAKGRFLANMTHELRTPLNAIIGFSQAIQSGIHGPLQPPQYGEYVAIIETSANHLLTLINDILDLSKLDSGTVELRYDVVDMGEVMKSCMALISHRATDTDVKLVRTFAEGSANIVQADALRIKQVFLNLLSNAIKFTPSGGRVEVFMEPATGHRGEAVLSVTVSDTGVGIRPEDIPKVLSEYGQAAHGLDHVVEGTGLGLPISKKLVELHGGRLTIQSALGEGTSVTVTLPRSHG
ncbi:MAG: PAS domain S-box protein [Alphaproteobacteria bacterium]|nr:PAS domain S-box protein [Alphaproteobacteria bacterium]MBF0249558.1 PAS domain S-box protein [Alphaproteobacteria bacterium]